MIQQKKTEGNGKIRKKHTVLFAGCKELDWVKFVPGKRRNINQI